MSEERKNKVCLICPKASFLDPQGICYKTGGLYCKRHERIVGKYDAWCQEALDEEDSEESTSS